MPMAKQYGRSKSTLTTFQPQHSCPHSRTMQQQMNKREKCYRTHSFHPHHEQNSLTFTKQHIRLRLNIPQKSQFDKYEGRSNNYLQTRRQVLMKSRTEF